MGLAAFVVFVVPWVLLAVFLTRSPRALRLGAPAAPWRPIPTRRDLAREANARSARTSGSSGSAARGQHPAMDPSRGGALGPSSEPTEPKE
jgi:hypothetical protein